MWWNIGPHLKKRLSSELEATKVVPVALGNAKDGSPRAAKKSGVTGNLAPKTLDGFLAILRRKFGSVTRAWRMCLDADESGTLTFREFTRALKEVGYTGDFRSLWFQLDCDLSGFISLHEMDSNAAMDLEKFRVLCIRQHGSMEGAWKRVMDLDRSGTVNIGEFWEACEKLGYTEKEEVDRLFGLLDVTRSDTISLEEVAFLQNWEEEKKKKVFMQRLPTRWVNKDPYLTAAPASEWNSSFQNPVPKITEVPPLPDVGPPVMPTLGEASSRRASNAVEPSPRRSSNVAEPSPRRSSNAVETPRRAGSKGAAGLTAEEEQVLRRIFTRSDAGDVFGKGRRDASIELKELQAAFDQDPEVQDFVRASLHTDVKSFFRDVDTDENRSVTWEELRAFYVRFKRSRADLNLPSRQASKESSPRGRAGDEDEMLRRTGSKESLASMMTSLSKKSAPQRRGSFHRKLSLNSFSGFQLPPSTPGTIEEEEDWCAPAAADTKDEWENFQRFLEKKHGSLLKAFDLMDGNNSGSLSLVEFQTVVCGSLRYCRASDAKRLYLGVVPDGDRTAGGLLTWREFGITPQEWTEYLHMKRVKAKQRQLNGPHGSKRAETATDDHLWRIKNPDPVRSFAFGMPLPKGWGFPPNFHPADAIRHKMNHTV